MTSRVGGRGRTLPPEDKKTIFQRTFLTPPPSSTALGAADTFHANIIAREMILSMGMGRRMGPVDLMHTTSTAQVRRGREGDALGGAWGP